MGKEVTKNQKEIINRNIEARKIKASSQEEYVEKYYGSEAEMKEKLSVELPGDLPDGRKANAFSLFNKRAIPAYLGMLAEIDVDPDITLDELLDLESVDAMGLKTAARDRLNEYLPKKTGDKVEYDHEEFKQFVVKNTAKLADKLDGLLADMKDKPLEEKQRLMAKYNVITEGYVDGYNQTFMRPAVIGRKEARENEEYKKLNDRCVAFGMAKDMIASTKALDDIQTKLKPRSKSSTANLDLSIYFAPNSYAARDEQPSSDGKDIVNQTVSFSNNITRMSQKANDDFEEGKSGLLGQLTDFERLVLATDPDLADKVKVSFVKGGADTATDYRMTYTDNTGKSFSLQTGAEPKDLNMHILARIKTDIYDTILKSGRYDDLEDEEKKEMEAFLEGSYADKIAKVQCGGTKGELDAISDRVKKDEELPKDGPLEYKVLFDTMMSEAQLLSTQFDVLMSDASETNKNLLNEHIEKTLKACDDFEKWCNDDNNRDELNFLPPLNISADIFRVIEGYKAKNDDLQTAIALQAQEVNKKKAIEEKITNQQIDETYNLSYAAGTIAAGLVKPDNMTEMEFNAVVLGALLDKEVTDKIKLPYENTERKEEQTWSKLLSELTHPDNEKNEHLGDAGKTAKEKAMAAIEAFKNNDRNQANKYIGQFINASVRLHDKNDVYGENTPERALKKNMLSAASELVKKEEYQKSTGYVNTINARKTVSDNISDVIKAGEASAIKVLNGEAMKRQERSEAVLNMLSSVYLKNKGSSEMKTNKDFGKNLAKDLLESKGVKVTDTIAGSKRVKNLNDAIKDVHNRTHYNDLEANFADKNSSDRMVNHLHDNLKKTDLYKLLMNSDIALNDLATRGDQSEILTGKNLDDISGISLLKFSEDANNETCEKEYKAAVEERWPHPERRYARRQLVEKTAADEIENRVELDYNKPLLGQYAGNLLDTVTKNRDDYIKQGISADKLKAFEDNLTKYDSFVKENFKDGEYNDSEIKAKAEEMKTLLSDMEKQYNDIFKAGKEYVDNPADLLAQDIKLYTDIAKMPEDGSIKKLIRSNINEHTGNKLKDLYGDAVSNRNMRDKVAYNFGVDIENLEEIGKDSKHPDEYKDVYRSAKYLKDLASHIGSKDEVDVIDTKDFNEYKEALNDYSDKVDAYLEALDADVSERRETLESIKKDLKKELKRVNKMDVLFNGETYFDEAKAEELAAETEAVQENDKVEEMPMDSNPENTEFRKSAVEDLYNKTNDASKLAMLSMADSQSKAKIEEFLEKFEYIAVRLKKLQTPNKDGSYIRFTKEIEDGLKKNLTELDKLAKGVGTALGKDTQVSKDLKDSFEKLTKNVSTAIKTDNAAIEKGVLYGSTAERYQKAHLKAIEESTDKLINSKAFGDKSSEEFKDLINSLSSLMKEGNRKEYNQGTAKTFRNKLETVSKNIDDYMKHKKFNNNGSLRSELRIKEVGKIRDYIKDIIPALNKEIETDSSKSRFSKMKYSKTKLGSADKIYNQIDQKRASLEKLEDDSFKEISVRACDAREKLADYYFRGALDKKLSEADFKDVQKCVATIALEKRIQLERKLDMNTLDKNEAKLTRGMTTLFMDKLNTKDKDNNIIVEDAVEDKEPQVSKVTEADRKYHYSGDLSDELDQINHGFVFNMLNDDGGEALFKAQEEKMPVASKKNPEPTHTTHKENVYDHMVNQVVDYNLISSDMVKADKVLGLLTDEKGETMDLYMKSLHGAVENSQQAKEAAAAKAARKETDPQLEAPKLS